MARYVDLEPEEQARVCAAAAEHLGLDEGSVEKDFWVCWTLRELFRLPEIGPHLTFKGGTSLSKGYGLIQRFSEDLDIVVDRVHLGFGGDRAPEAPGISGKERDRRLDALKTACREFVAGRLLGALAKRAEAVLGDGGPGSLQLDDDDPDGQTLLFEYPKSARVAEYLRPVVKIEVGGRSDTDPTDTPTMRAYLAETSPDLAECSPFSVRTVGPERTFWEKAMLLHEEAHRAGGAGPKLRMSRHYYDLHCLIDRLIKRGTAKDAVVDLKLFKAIADHRAVYFKRSKEAQATLKPGTLRLRPADGSLGLWKSDYEKMSEVMFWGDPPSFEEIIATVEEFETSFNREAGSSTAG